MVLTNRSILQIALLVSCFLLPAGSALHSQTRPADQSAATRPSKPGESLVNSIGMKLIFIPAGEFGMGSPTAEPMRGLDETWHRVRLTKPFLMGTIEVSQSQWEAVMGSNPSKFKGDGHLPVESVSWDDAAAFCKKLSQLEGKHYRLPTEAEWEYACRAGTTTPFSTGETINVNQANYDGNFPYENSPIGPYRARTIPVGTLPANPWGLFDMHGNVWEWCADYYAAYPSRETVDPAGPAQGSVHILRGGSWYSYGQRLRSARRRKSTADYRNDDIGFRVVLDL